MGTSLRMMRVIDSHTAAQPTRVIVDGGPDLGVGSLAERRDRFRAHFDRFRTAIVGEPRGSDTLVGAILCKASDPSCAEGVIFFDSAGYLDISIHGMMGLAVTLDYIGRLGIGEERIETPAGVVTLGMHPNGDITVRNVPSYRFQKDVSVTVDGTTFVGDVAWSGSWSFLVNDFREELSVARAERLTDLARSIRRALARNRITGSGDEEITDIALFGPPQRRDANSRNFVLRSGKTFRRSPSGTATSAKLACLYADGKLAEGQTWRQESIIGTVFDGSVKVVDGAILPTIRSTAHLIAESVLIVDERDPYCWGLS
ncbi:MAG TPA: proline racemase family protein [Thermoanaerobaculia bacterium]|nr:proline racemase family protein [Thermoanaerobaculia bacterium]